MPVTLNGLGHRYGEGPWLFRDVNASLADGDLVALVGPSGSGKSTLLGILAHWIDPVEGSVDGAERCSWVSQQPFGVARRTVVDHVLLPLLARGVTRRDAEADAMRLLERFAIARLADSEFRRLSGGEAQRLMFARALATNAPLLLVDEPTASLDRATAAVVDGVLRELAGDGHVVVVATHDERTRQACSTTLDLTEFAA